MPVTEVIAPPNRQTARSGFVAAFFQDTMASMTTLATEMA